MAEAPNKASVTVVEAEGGIFKLDVVRGAVAHVEVVDVDLVLFLKQGGARIVLVNAAMDAMSDHPPIIQFADASNMPLSSLLDEVGNINIGDTSLPALSSFLPFDKSDAVKQLNDANSSFDQSDTNQQSQPHDKLVAEGLAPTNSEPVDVIQQMIKSGVVSDKTEDFPDPPNPNVIVLVPVPPSLFSPPSSGATPSSFPPILLVDILNVVEQGQNGNIIYGGGGDPTTVGNASPGAQMMAETISGSAGADVIYSDATQYLGNGFAKILHFQAAGNITTLNTLTIQNIPAGWTIVGATDIGGGSWTLPLNGLVTSNGFDIKLMYASFEADSANPVHVGPVDIKFTVGITDASGASGSISNTLLLAVADAVYPSDLSYVDVNGQTVTVLPAQGNPDYVLAGAGDDTVYASLGNDTILGQAGNDLLDGGSGNDSLYGGDGNDTLIGGSGADHLDGGAGENWANFNDANAISGVTVNLATGLGNGGFAQGDTYTNIQDVQGSAFDDVLIGDASNNSLLGNVGNDTLIGGAGNNYLDGGSGTDTADYSAATNALTIALDAGGNAVNVNNGQGGTDQLASIENLIGGSAGDLLTGSAVANTLLGGGGDDTLDGAAGADLLDGGSGSNWASYQSASTGIVADLGTPANNSGDATGDSYINIQNLLGSNLADTLNGDANINVLDGAGGNDTLYGNGNDTLIGGAGADSLVGQAGTINWASYQTSAIGVVADMGNTAINTGDASGDTYSNIQNLLGSNFDDTLYGDGGNNTISGGTGNDTLDGGGGNDLLDGGAGIDKVSFASLAAGAGVTLDSGGGANVIATSGINTATLANIEIFEGSNNADTMTGGSGNDSFYGLSGSDTLDGGFGSDYLDGGAGADTVTFASLGTNGVTITIDSVDPTKAYAVATNLAGTGTDTDTLVNVENIIGGSGDDTIFGSSANNVFAGGVGNDTLYGGAGDDTLSGDSGNDVIYGDAGNDTLNAGAGNNTLDGGAGADILNGGGGLTDVNWAGYQSATAGVVADLGNAANNNVTVNDASGDTYNAIQNLLGSNFADTLTGDGGDNIIDGASGNDTIYGAAGNDTLSGGTGNDTLYGGNNDDTLFGGAGDDNLDGGLGNDMLEGGAGADVLNGGAVTGDVNWASYQTATAGVVAAMDPLLAGITAGDAAGDTYSNIQNLIGSTFDDTLYGDALNNSIDGSAGNDTLYGGDGIDTLLGGDGNDVLDGGNGNDYIDGGAGIDKVSFLSSAVGVNISVSPSDPTTATATDGIYTDTIVNVEIIEGSNYNDVLSGTTANNTLLGGGGDDTLDGGGGIDTLDGGAGTDIVSFASYGTTPVTVNVTGGNSVATAGSDTITLINIEELIGGAGNDTISGDGLNNIFFGGAGNDTLAGGIGSDTIHGDDGNDVIFGDLASTANSTSPSDGADTLYGDAGNDTIYAGGGDDMLEGGAGADKLYGGAGNNWASYVNSTAVIVNLGTSIASGGESAGDILNNIQNLIGGVGDDILSGDANINIFLAGDGNDTLAGGLGNDTLDGGAGVDTVDYSGAIGSVIVDLAANASFGTATGADGNDILYGIENVLGSNNNDTLTGDANGNLLSGNAGNDNLYAGAGASTLDGGDGNDTLIGGAGDDTLLGGTGNDYLDGGDGVNFLDGGAGIDTVNFLGISGGVSGTTGVVITGNPDGTATATIELSSGSLATETMKNIEIIIGSNNDDYITGTDGDNTLYGKGGNDTLFGSLGNDIIYGGDAVIDTGNDTVGYVNATGSVTVNLAAGAGFGSATGADGNDTLYGIENVIGSNYADTIYSDSNANFIDGGAGSDTISYTGSGAGVTLMLNGASNSSAGIGGLAAGDILVNVENLIGSNFNDYIYADSNVNTIDGNGGADIVDYSNSASAVTVSLDGTAGVGGYATGDVLANVENLTGSSFNDILTGNAGNNTLSGGSGNDTLVGGTGTNLLDGGTGIDSADYSAQTAAVIVSLMGAADGSASGTGITDTLRGIENVIGGSGNDTIYSDSNANFINGNGGTDVVDYSNSTSGVTVSLAGTAGVGGYGTGDVLTNVENLIGSSYNDILTGNAGNNILTGGGGNDTLYGMGGYDTLFGGFGNDTLVAGYGASLLDGGGAASGYDTADFSAISNSLTIVMNGSANGSATGLGVNDILQGYIENIISGSGNDIIYSDYYGNFIDGGAGNDTVSYVSNSTIGVSITLNGASYSTPGGGGPASFSAGDILVNIENLNGSKSDDILNGDSGVNILNGGSGNDTIDGGLGDDTLLGGAGADTLTGGGGADYIDGGTSADTLIMAVADLSGASLNGGTDASIDTLQITGIASAGNLDLASFDANVSSIEKLDIKDGVSSILTLGLTDIQAMVDNGNTSSMTIRMDTGDTLSFNLSPNDSVSSAFDPTFAVTHYTFANSISLAAATLDLVTV